MIIIDGYNLLHSIEKADADAESVGDVQLCSILSRYLKLIGETGEIIFDGIGPPDKSGFDNISKLEVVFSGRTSEADDIIEHKITANTAPRRLTVVSSDRRLRRAAHARKCPPPAADAVDIPRHGLRLDKFPPHPAALKIHTMPAQWKLPTLCPRNLEKTCPRNKIDSGQLI